MSALACAVDELELGALLDGELSENRARQLREHVGGCATCSAGLERLEVLIAQLRTPVPQDDPDFITATMNRLPPRQDKRQPPARERRRRPWMAGSLAVVAAATFVLLFRPAPALQEQFAARGGETRWQDLVSVSLSAVSGGSAKAETVKPLTPGARLHAGDGVAVYARNGNQDTPVYLMVFAVDAKNDVHWILPAWTNPAQNPASVTLQPDGVPLSPEGIAPEAPAAGPFRIFTLLTRAPLDVRAVEARLRQGRPFANNQQHVVALDAEIGAN